ncbi:unnamed protein product, partial [Meganyctiphanes norvegica]
FISKRERGDVTFINSAIAATDPRTSLYSFSMMMKLAVTLFVVAAVAVEAAQGAAAQRDDSHGFKCYGVGAFPDQDCKGFHLCQLRGDTYVDSFFPCPEGTHYDVIHKTCNAGGDCPTAINKPLEL